jgi:UDP-3-O-[3-hydroxymyristoyl] glucosamine N-acyltransferase
MNRTAREVAEYLGAQVEGDASARIAGLAGPEAAGPEDLIYVESARNAARAASSKAQCVLCPAEITLAGKTRIMVQQPKLAFAKVADWLLPKPRVAAGVHSTAVIAASARVAAEAAIGPCTVIEDNAEIAAGAQIGAHCFVGAGARVGQGSILYPRVTLYPGVHLGQRVIVHSGAVLGGDGFGYVRGDDRYWKFPQLGSLEIGDDVEIGANTTVDRGALDTTRIAAGVKIDNLVQIAHNVQVGEHAVIAAQTGVSGSSIIDRNAVIGGQVGIADHCTIEEGAVCGAQAGIPSGKKIRKGQVVWGTPARPLDRFKEQYAWFARLPELAERLRALEAKTAAPGDPS